MLLHTPEPQRGSLFVAPGFNPGLVWNKKHSRATAEFMTELHTPWRGKPNDDVSTISIHTNHHQIKILQHTVLRSAPNTMALRKTIFVARLIFILLSNHGLKPVATRYIAPLGLNAWRNLYPRYRYKMLVHFNSLQHKVRTHHPERVKYQSWKIKLTPSIIFSP